MTENAHGREIDCDECSAKHCRQRPFARLAIGQDGSIPLCSQHYREWRTARYGLHTGNYRRLLLKNGQRLVPNIIPYRGYGGVHLEETP